MASYLMNLASRANIRSDEHVQKLEGSHTSKSKERSSSRESVHALLLIAAFYLLQFSQFVSGTIALIIIAVIYALSWLTWPRITILYGPFTPFIALMAFSMFWSEHPGGVVHATFGAAVVIAAGLSVGAALPLEAILRIINRTTVYIGAISLFLGIALPQYGLHSGPAYAGTLVGLYISKNSLAVVILFGALAVLFRDWPNGGGIWRIIGSYLIYIPVFWKTESATTLAILAGGILLWIVYEWWRRAPLKSRAAAWALLLTPVVVVVALAWTIYTGVLALLGRDATLTGRTEIWIAAIDAWQTQPWLGVGWGSFATDSTVSYFQFMSYGWVRSHAHSGYIQVLTELGIAGIAFLAITLIIILIGTVGTVRRTPSKANGWLIVAVVTFLVHNVAEQSMRLLPLFILALVYAACVRQRPEAEESAVGTKKYDLNGLHNKTMYESG